MRVLTEQLTSSQQTIALLVAEKASLSAALDRLSDVEASSHETARMLVEARKEVEELRTRVEAADRNANEGAAQSYELAKRARELEDRCKEQDRELQLTKASIDEYRTDAERSARHVRELEEQIQSDDRVERAESALQNVQNRATELEVQLSKLKQSHALLRTEHEGVHGQLETSKGAAASWEAKHAALRNQHTDLQTQLSSAQSEYRSLTAAKSSTEDQLATAQQQVVALREDVARVTAEHIASMRQLQTAQSDARAATRRAEIAERTQADLQAESSRLLAAVEEMRPKIVELTDVRLALTERAAALEAAVRERDAVIATAEGAEHEARGRAEALEEQLRDALAVREREKAEAQEERDELQRGFAELQAELEDARAAVRDLEVERTTQRALTVRQTAELEILGGAQHTLADELSGVRRELEETKLAAAEQEDFLERARMDIEALRADKENELDVLRSELALLQAGSASPALGEELLASLRQQHHLELSAAQSQIRALQAAVFEADARVHALQRQLRTTVDVRNSGSSELDKRPPSRARTSSDDMRRAARRASGGPPGTTQTTFGANLSAETRHKRKVSLGMLKARIDSEVAAAVASNPASRAISPLPGAGLTSVPEDGGMDAGLSPKRPQFLDESHIFWCSSCRGELVIL
ncbi:hypothetical protein K488DRAFT_43965 [Vararia minispora EC-137]|uniref:Uncharacterized protein n=1 Tax=Vararia minispora EC-137 TaxID=1314806 RepID=A0ACB8QTU8_9AGAM|nr:hypothetical protein K488DRAFT_43965 [Vararia minispora EC-137]